MTGGILIFGPNGAGKTTLARALARLLGCKHMDSEDYFFRESEIPFTNPRTRDEAIGLLHADIAAHPLFVLSACTGDFGAEIISKYALAVFVTAPKELRMQRIEQREEARFGARVRPGGDMYERESQFRAWAASRDLSKIDAWAQTLACPVIHADGTRDIAENAARITAEIKV
ncbi:MAG: AAA family ATPase [Firmicutes bacterium]|nr:AAA family ATPase [Bacillota bacterium]